MLLAIVVLLVGAQAGARAETADGDVASLCTKYIPGTQYKGSDVDYLKGTTLGGCYDACKAMGSDRCGAFVLKGGTTCFMKKLLDENRKFANGGYVSCQMPAGEAEVDPNGLSTLCGDNYYKDRGVYGNDLDSKCGTTEGECYTWCKEDTKCAGFSFHTTKHCCYRKTYMQYFQYFDEVHVSCTFPDHRKGCLDVWPDQIKNLIITQANALRVPEKQGNAAVKLFGVPKKDGTNLQSFFPNNREKFLLLDINSYRLWPEDYKKGPFGFDNDYYDDGKYCGRACPNPMYWWQDTGEAARYMAWGRSTYGFSQHTDSNPQCAKYKTCSFGDRSYTFNTEKPHIKSEGIGSDRGMMTDGHCGGMFLPERWGIGIGAANNAKADSGVQNYLSGGPDPSEIWPIPVVSHYPAKLAVQGDRLDEFIKQNGDKEMAFGAIFHSKSESVKKAYLVYQGKKNEMKRSYGNDQTGRWDYYTDYPETCEPYFVIFETTSGKKYRMPENPALFWGTAWPRFSYWDPETGTNTVNKAGQEKVLPPGTCEENHYKLEGNEAYGNAVLEIVKSGLKGGNCKGCSKVSKIANIK